MRVLTGLQPSGKLHLGNYFSAIKKILDYQSKEELFLFIANLHALTTFRSKEELKTFTLECAIDLLALGVDPQKTVFGSKVMFPKSQNSHGIYLNPLPFRNCNWLILLKTKWQKDLSQALDSLLIRY